jgi:DNA-binding NarL/FixJ family response regulator
MSLHAYKDSKLPLVLLYDSEYMIRSVFALLANQTAKASVMETAHLATANNLCQTNAFELIIIGMGHEHEEKHFIELIRNGMTLTDKSVPIVVMTSAITEELLYELKSLNVTDILLKPTRVKAIHDVFLRNIN